MCIKNQKIFSIISCILSFNIIFSSLAHARNVPIIRDAEIENMIQSLARPLLSVAGIPNTGTKIIIVRNREFNAFVSDPGRIFINMGAIMDTKTPNQLSGVIAHEIGHLAGSHLSRLRERLKRARTLAIVSALFGAGTSIAGAAQGNSDVTALGQGIAAGGSTAAMRDLLSYRRSEELAADKAGLSYLRATKQSAKGMIEVFEKFASQSMFLKNSIDPYSQSHPMPRDRIASTLKSAQASPYYDKQVSAQDQLRYDLIKAKLAAYTTSATTILKRYKKSDNSLPAVYARAIALYRSKGVKDALPLVNRLINSAPKYAYFHEFKGQIYLETAQPKAAIAPLREAVKLNPNSGLIRVTYGRALLALNNDKSHNEAIKQLERGLRLDPQIIIGHRQLAIAYGAKGQIGKAELATARAYLYSGRTDLTAHHAKRAKEKLKRGSPSWLQADSLANINK